MYLYFPENLICFLHVVWMEINIGKVLLTGDSVESMLWVMHFGIWPVIADVTPWMLKVLRSLNWKRFIEHLTIDFLFHFLVLNIVSLCFPSMKIVPLFLLCASSWVHVLTRLNSYIVHVSYPLFCSILICIVVWCHCNVSSFRLVYLPLWGMHCLQVIYPIRKYQSAPSAPRLKLVSTPELRSLFSVEDFKLLTWLDGM